jgi:hypothetical protein
MEISSDMSSGNQRDSEGAWRAYARMRASLALIRITESFERKVLFFESFYLEIVSHTLRGAAFEGKRDVMEALHGECVSVRLQNIRQTVRIRDELGKIAWRSRPYADEEAFLSDLKIVERIEDEGRTDCRTLGSDFADYERRFYEILERKIVRPYGESILFAICMKAGKRAGELFRTDEIRYRHLDEWLERMFDSGFSCKPYAMLREVNRMQLGLLVENAMLRFYDAIWQVFGADMMSLLEANGRMAEAVSVIRGCDDIDRMFSVVKSGIREYNDIVLLVNVDEYILSPLLYSPYTVGVDIANVSVSKTESIFGRLIDIGDRILHEYANILAIPGIR